MKPIASRLSNLFLVAVVTTGFLQSQSAPPNAVRESVIPITGGNSPAGNPTGNPAGPPVVVGQIGPVMGPGALIGSADTVTIIALNADEISKAWRVNTTGDLNLPMVGRVHAAGMTVDQLEQEVATKLKKYLRDPQVTAYISERLSHPMTVSGAVNKPGVIQLTGPTPLFAVLVEAGGLRDGATSVKVTRLPEEGVTLPPLARISDDGKYQVLESVAKAAVAADSDSGRFMILPGDVVAVLAEKRTRLVYIIGEVNKPGQIELDTQDTVNVITALAMAGGPTKLAKPSKTVIRHINAKGVETALNWVDMTKVMDGKSLDLQLSDGDVMVIPSNQWLTYIQNLPQTGLSTGLLFLGRL